MLIGSEVHTADRGDLLVVPPHLNHAFAAHPGSTAEALIVITPGIQRFDYFRLVQRTRAGLEPPETLRAIAGPVRHVLRRQRCLAGGSGSGLARAGRSPSNSIG